MMNLMDDDFNSSDIEFPEPDPDPYPNAGRRSIEIMRANAAQDRVRTEILVRQLRLMVEDPVKECQLALWSNLFKAFQENTLSCDSKRTPTADQIVRFFFVVTRYIRGQGSHNVASCGCLQTGIMCIEEWASFYFRDFELNGNHRVRIASMFREFLGRGDLTQVSAREDQLRSTRRIVSEMIRVLYKHAIQRGTTNWDIVVMKALSLLLQTSLAAQSGGMAYRHEYQGRECLRWEHIIICIDPDSKKLSGTITLTCCKKQKSDSIVNRHLKFKELLDPQYNHIDVIKLLIAFALRIGAVAETSKSQLISNMLARPNKRIVWSQPSRPVLCRVMADRQILNFDRPADRQLVLRTIQEAALLIFRQGSAYEQASTRIAGGSVAKDILGDNEQPKIQDISGYHVGRSTHDTWTTRFEIPAPQCAKHVVQFASEAPAKKRRKAVEITQICESEEIDPKDKKEGALIAAETSGENLQGCRDKQAAVSVLPCQKKHSSASRDGALRSEEVDSEATSVQHKLSDLNTANEDLDSDADFNQLNDLLHNPCDSTLGTDQKSMQQHEQILSQMTELEIRSLRDQVNLESIDDDDKLAYTTLMARKNATVLDSKDADSLLKFLSTVNVYRLANDESLTTMASTVQTGGSRDPPSRFLFHCPNDGCSAVYDIEQDAIEHIKVCTIPRR